MTRRKNAQTKRNVAPTRDNAARIARTDAERQHERTSDATSTSRAIEWLPDLNSAAHEAAGKLAVAIRLLNAHEDHDDREEEDSDGWDLSLVRDLLIDIQTMLRGCVAASDAADAQREGAR
jgi:hypothetical protein